MTKKQKHKVTEKDFEKLELRVGTVKAVKRHQNERDYIILVDLGPVEQDLQVVADLKESYSMSELIGKQAVVIVNIRHETIGGIESQGMIFVTRLKGKKRLVSPDKKVFAGVKVFGIMDSSCTHKES